MSTVDKRLVESRISGFPEHDPEAAIVMARVHALIRSHYERAGYVPLESPLVERTAILAAKASGEIKKQVYGLRLLNPADATDDSTTLGLRFDHTVQLARYVAARHESGVIRFPFRRFALGPVFRGEQPGPGRSRQFIQADVDVIGKGKLSFAHDAEMVGIISDIFSELAVGSFTIRINNRKVLEGALREAGCDTAEKVRKAREIIDEVDKIGFDETVSRLVPVGFEQAKARTLVESLKMPMPITEMLESLRSNHSDPSLLEGVAELEEVLREVSHLGVPKERYALDPSLARGLDYYTSTVFEARLDDHPRIGSIAGGGRYDNLAEEFTDAHLPGVGISIGTTRLVGSLIENRLLEAYAKTVSPVLVTRLEPDVYGRRYAEIARSLRASGIGAEIYLESEKLGKQIEFAAKRGFTAVIIAGSREFEHREGDTLVPVVKVKLLEKGEEVTLQLEGLPDALRSLLS